MKDFSVNIIGLSNKVHLFQFELEDDFFERYGKELFSKGDFDSEVSLDKRETFIEVDFKISGHAELIWQQTLVDQKYRCVLGYQEFGLIIRLMDIRRIEANHLWFQSATN